MRTRMVTRTVKFTDVKVMVVNMNNDTPTLDTVYVSVTGNLEGKDLEKATRKLVESREGLKFVSIVDTIECEQIYGMPESEFIALAKIITR